MNEAWLILLFSGWYVKAFKLEAGEDKHSFRGSLHPVPVKHGPFQVFPPSWGRVVRRQGGSKARPVQRSTTPSYLPTRLSRRSPHLVSFSRSDRAFARESLVSPLRNKPEMNVDRVVNQSICL